MKHLILHFAMNALLANTINAQAPQPMKPTPNWLAAVHATLGTNAPAGWFMDLDADGMETYVTADKALVIVDRSPIVERNGGAYFRSPMSGLDGTQLGLIGEVDQMGGSVMHGVYSGLLGGMAVMMDQYVQLRNCMPITIVRVITRVNGSEPQVAFDQEELVEKLLDPSMHNAASVQQIDHDHAEGSANATGD